MGLYFSTQKLFLLIMWVHNDFMYVRFAGIRNTKTWSKSTNNLISPCEGHRWNSGLTGLASNHRLPPLYVLTLASGNAEDLSQYDSGC